ncbi:hypothetical protein HJ181_21850 [Vibrio parahaemolyticus]|nr:hypothetical protein [Vibrio parahaemolyticus]
MVARDANNHVCTTNTKRNLPFVKYANTDDYVAVAAGEKIFCDQFVTQVKNGKYREAMILLNSVPIRKLSTIVVSKKDIIELKRLTRCNQLSQQMLFSGSGGAFYFHERIHGCTPEDAFDRVCKNYYNFCGGEMRYFDFDTGETNMDDKADKLREQCSSEYENVIFPVGETPYAATVVSPEKDEDPHALSIEDILSTEA